MTQNDPAIQIPPRPKGVLLLPGAAVAKAVQVREQVALPLLLVVPKVPDHPVAMRSSMIAMSQ
jgi:hypothetical protein